MVGRRLSIALALTFFASVLTAPLAQASSGTATSFVCFHPVEVCVLALREAGGSPELAAQNLAETPQAAETEYGVTTNQGFATVRYYGWRLSNNLSFGRRYTVNVCGSNGCTYVGDVGYQATFAFNGRQVRNTRATVYSELRLDAEISQERWCREKPSTSCGEYFTGWGPLVQGGSNFFAFPDLFLANDAWYDVGPRYVIRFPGVVAGFSPIHYSLDFRCDRAPDVILNKNECYYPFFGQGDAY